MIFKITVSAIRPHIGGARRSKWRAYVLEPTREKCAHEVAIDAAHWEGLKTPKVVAIGPAQVVDGIPAILAACDLKAFAISNVNSYVVVPLATNNPSGGSEAEGTGHV